ncbi:MAG: DUF933 domain-containing protein [Planctomycetota bacterium]|jgi:hypothetical protein
MKIGYTSIDLPEGKFKYQDERLIALTEKDDPKKVAPYYAEFIPNEFVQTEAIVVPADKVLDLLIFDIEAIDARIGRLEDGPEKSLMERCMEALEAETPLCDLEYSEEERIIMREVLPYSYSPVIQVQGDEDVNDIIGMAFDKADYMFFYTSGPKEAHAWLTKKNSTALECAAKIHSDLARGFIKADVVAFDDYLKAHSFKECIANKVAKLVDKDYIIQAGDVLEIRFSV